MGKVAISMTTGLEDPEKVTVALLTAVGAAEQGRPTLVFMTKETVRLGLESVAVGTACEGCPPRHGRTHALTHARTRSFTAAGFSTCRKWPAPSTTSILDPDAR